MDEDEKQEEKNQVKKRLKVVMTDVCIGQVKEELEKSFNEVLRHVNVKRIQV